MNARMTIAIVMLGLALSLSAAESHAPSAAPAHHETDKTPGPVTSEKAEWAPGVLLVIGILFAAAAFVGPIYRLNMPEEPQVEDFHSHDEPPGTSHHHGASGTIDHSAPDKPHHH